MNAAKDLGSVPGAGNVMADALRLKHQRARGRSDPATDAPADTSTDGRADPRVRAREGTETRPDEPVRDEEMRTGSPESDETGQPTSTRQKTVQGPRRMLEVKARAYRGGWDKLRPRAEALADAVRDVLSVGGTPAEVRGLLAEVGVGPDALPPEVRDALRRK